MLTKRSNCFIAFLQATGVATYIGLISLIFIQGENLFGNTPNYFGPLLFLLLFVFSALITSLMVFYYPAILFWEKKKVKKSLKIVLYTALWLLGYFLTTLTLIIALS